MCASFFLEMMDVMSVLIGLAICLFTAVILYFISVKSFQVLRKLCFAVVNTNILSGKAL